MLCTSPGVGEGRTCPLLTFQLGSRTGIQDRHVLPASVVGSMTLRRETPPGNLVLRLGAEEGARNVQVIKSAQLQ